MENYLFVRCCDDTRGESGDCIFYEPKTDTFHYRGNEELFKFCPWCGTRLTKELEMTPETPYVEWLQGE
jgi:hypothetical protein